jgi:hypothetical protein
MNAVEIEEAVSNLALQTFDKDEFPYAFLSAFGNKETTLKRLRAGASNKSDLGGILQTNNLHILVSEAGEVGHSLEALKASPATAKAKARFIVATDGLDFEAEDLTTGETVASLIFFTGRRAVDQLVPEFQAYAKKYEPCFVYTDVPLSEVYVFLSQFGSGQTNARNHHKTAREI